MTKRFWGQDGDPGPGVETFAFEQYALCEDMRLCPDCGEISGFLRYAQGGPFKLQTCSCRDLPVRPEDAEDFRRFFRLDFPSAVTLCACCGQILMKNGSRFSPFCCEGCRKFIMAYNSLKGVVVVPMGRHSMMNGLQLSGRDADDPETIFNFVEGMNSLVARMELLDEWKKVIIADNFRRLGHPKDWDMGLYDYLDAMPEDWFSFYMAFLGLHKFFLAKCQAPPGDPRLQDTSEGRQGRNRKEDLQALYVRGAEVRGVFYTLVARVEAIEKRWPGGLRSYLRKYGGAYNDYLALACQMGLYFEDHLVDLADKGLEFGKDFTLFDASDAIKMKDGTPCDTHVDWLAGYYKEAGVMVYLKQ